MAVTTTATSGIEIGRRALQAQQTALQVTSHNIANANTPGFSRRGVELENVGSAISGGIGSGTDVAAIVRQRSRFLDSQIRAEQQVLGRWEAIERSLTIIESIFNEPVGAGSSEAGAVFNEPSGMGLSGSLSRFWNSWQDLANVPEGGAARAVVRQESQHLVTTMHQIHKQLGDTRIGIDDQIGQEVGEINDILDQLAIINGQIPNSRFAGGTAGDLEDQRDRLIERLAEKVDITVIEKDTGAVSILISGHNLVQSTTSVHLAVRTLPQNDFPATTLFFSDDGSLAPIQDGKLKGLLEVRDNTIPNYLSRLDELAETLVTEINALHRVGFGATGATGIDFFDVNKTTASNISLDERIIDDLNNIAASGDGNGGDNGTALDIAGLRNEKVLGAGTTTIEGFFNTLIGEVGAASKEAQTMAENNRLFSTQIENRRQSVQGVSLNDEAAKLVLFQRAYQAAARTVSIIDDLMEVAIGL